MTPESGGTHAAPPDRFLLLVYRMPTKPTAGRVAVWRTLKKAGAVYLTDSACVLPDLPHLRKEIGSAIQRVEASEGRYHLLPLTGLPHEEQAKLAQLFRDQSAKHYSEIVENCEVNFVKEIEFERFRENFTYEEAEEIRVEFEKIGSWLERVQERDWFGAPNREEAATWLRRCESLLDDFEAKVFEMQGTGEQEAAGRASPVALPDPPETGERAT